MTLYFYQINGSNGEIQMRAAEVAVKQKIYTAISKEPFPFLSYRRELLKGELGRVFDRTGKCVVVLDEANAYAARKLFRDHFNQEYKDAIALVNYWGKFLETVQVREPAEDSEETV